MKRIGLTLGDLFCTGPTIFDEEDSARRLYAVPDDKFDECKGGRLQTQNLIR